MAVTAMLSALPATTSAPDSGDPGVIVRIVGTFAGDASNAEQVTQTGKLTDINTELDTITGHVDGLETLVTSTNTKLDTLNTSVVAATTATVAHDAAAAAINPLLTGGYASEVRPTAVSAANDAVRDWVDFYGARKIIQSGFDVVDYSWTVDTNALAAGDVMVTAAAEIASFFRHINGVVRIHGLTVHDADDQGIAFDLYLENAGTSLGTQNGAPSISDANGEVIIGVIPIDAADYYDVGAFKKAFVGAERSIIVKAGGASTSIWISGVTRGAPTYAGGVLKLKFQIEHIG